jgi:hypothetical protein
MKKNKPKSPKIFEKEIPIPGSPDELEIKHRDPGDETGYKENHGFPMEWNTIGGVYQIIPERIG